MSRPTISIPAASEDRVLLALEDDVSAELLTHRMIRRGIHPERAESGSEAIYKLQNTPYDLVIIETRFPGLTGLELLQHSPSEEIAGEPRIILLGQGGDNQEIIRAFELGAAEYIQRPFAPEVALARIVRFLGDGRQLVSRPPSAAVLPLLATPASFSGLLEGSISPAELMIGITAVLIFLAFILATLAITSHLRAKTQEQEERDVTTTWKELLLDILAGDAPPARLIQEVAPNQQRLFLEFLVPYAVTFEGETKRLLIQLAKPFMIRLEQDLERWGVGRRARAVQLFGLLGDASCRGILRARLDDPSKIVAYTAFQWLARRGHPQHDTQPLLKRLDRFSNYDAKQLSSLLVKLGPSAAPMIRSYLRDEHNSTFVRLVCAETLRWMGDAETAPIAAQILVYEPHPELVASLLRLLRRVGRPEHAPLVRSYCQSEVPFIRIHAARALGQIGHPEDDRKLLRSLVTDTRSRWVALNAAKSLKELNQTTPLHHLSRTNHEYAPLASQILKEPES